MFSYQLEGMGREEDWPGEPRRRKRKFQTKCSNSQSLNIELNKAGNEPVNSSAAAAEVETERKKVF